MAYKKDINYQELIDKAVEGNDLYSAAQYERQRNEKIDGEGSSYAKTYKYQQYLPSVDMPTDYGKAARDLVTKADNMTYGDWKNGDVYKALAQQYAYNGNKAMQDTVANVSARTGGLASSYAGQVGQQTYNDYMRRLEDAAMQMYANDKNDLYTQANMQRQLDNDMLGYATAERNFAYGRAGDAAAQALADRNFAYQKGIDERNFEYQKGIDERNFEYNKGIDERNFEYQKEQDALANALRVASASRSSRGSSPATSSPKATTNAPEIKNAIAMAEKNPQAAYDYLTKTYSGEDLQTALSLVFYEDELAELAPKTGGNSRNGYLDVDWGAALANAKNGKTTTKGGTDDYFRIDREAAAQTTGKKADSGANAHGGGGKSFGNSASEGKLVSYVNYSNAEKSVMDMAKRGASTQEVLNSLERYIANGTITEDQADAIAKKLGY